VLKRLFIDNFRCLTNFEVKPDRVAALVGPNGGGKSAIFDILLALQGFLTAGQDTNACFPPFSRTRWDKRPVQRIEMDVEASGAVYTYSLEIIHSEKAEGVPLVHEEQLTVDGRTLYRLAGGEVQLFGDIPAPQPRTSFPFAATRSFLPLLEPRPDNTRIFAFKRWVSGLFLFRLNPQSIESLSQAESRSIQTSGANFVSWYRALVQESHDVASRVEEDLRSAIPGLVRIQLLLVGPIQKVMNIECDLSGSKFGLFLNELSDGQRALLVLYSILRALPEGASMLVFDEPDNFLAEVEIQPWLSSMREAVLEVGRCTLLVISHHPEVIDYLAPDQIFVLRRDSGGPTRLAEMEVDRDKGLTASQWLRLGAGDAG
jgi:ABC-type dipeptide/oligopeptide/nickel transport system ATPase subunit